MSNAALLPIPEQQFFDVNGAPLSGGLIYTYAAGTTTPQAAYTDASGTTALTNPVVLDSGGRASIWLGQENYKIVATDAAGSTQWTVDSVSSVSLGQLQGNADLTSLAVTGDGTIGGGLTVTGALTAASASITGTLAAGGAFTGVGGTFSAALNAASLAVSGNATVGGTLGVTGAASVASLNVGGQTLTAFVQALIPALTGISGALVISAVAVSGGWVIFTFGTTAGTLVKIAFGAGQGAANGSAIPLPSGFTATQMIALASLNSVSTGGSGNNITQMTIGLTGATINATAADFSGHSYTPTASWIAVAWLTGQ